MDESLRRASRRDELINNVYQAFVREHARMVNGMSDPKVLTQSNEELRASINSSEDEFRYLAIALAERFLQGAKLSLWPRVVERDFMDEGQLGRKI